LRSLSPSIQPTPPSLLSDAKLPVVVLWKFRSIGHPTVVRVSRVDIEVIATMMMMMMMEIIIRQQWVSVQPASERSR